jgi:hypothetical protein
MNFQSKTNRIHKAVPEYASRKGKIPVLQIRIRIGFGFNRVSYNFFSLLSHQNRDRDPIRIGIQPKILDPDQMNTDPHNFTITVWKQSSASYTEENLGSNRTK